MPSPRLFLLSPAHAGGVRARFLLNPRATFALARQFHAEGLPLATVFTFASGLYFRGKIAYARKFARSEDGDVVRIITSNAGLVDPDRVIGPAELAAFGTTSIDAADAAYHQPLRVDATVLRETLGAGAPVILLGSIATPKYRQVLLEVFGTQLRFPPDFVGRGDMSRGALLLRAAAAGVELAYGSVDGAIFKGRRAAKVGSFLSPAAPAVGLRHQTAREPSAKPADSRATRKHSKSGTKTQTPRRKLRAP